jgi:predicted dehydrogenase
MLLDWGMHLFDQALLLKEGVKVAYVSAVMSFVQGHEVDDGFTANLTFEDGDEIVVEVGTCNLIPMPRWYLVAENGTAVVRAWNTGVEIVTMPEHESEGEVAPVRTAAGISKTMAPRPPETVHKKAMPIVESDVCEYYENFARSADGFDKLFVSVEDIIRVTKLIDTVRRAAQTHETLRFEEP